MCTDQKRSANLKKIGIGPVPDANVEERSTRTQWASKSHLHTWIITANSITCEHRGHLGTQYNSVPETNQDNDIFNQTRLEFM